ARIGPVVPRIDVDGNALPSIPPTSNSVPQPWRLISKCKKSLPTCASSMQAPSRKRIQAVLSWNRRQTLPGGCSRTCREDQLGQEEATMQTRMFHLTPSIGIALAVFLLFIVFIGQAASTKGPAATSANPIAPHQENGEVLARRAISIPYGMQNA